MIVMDLQAIYPPSMVPGFMQTIKLYYVDTYKDQFFVDTPNFFRAFIWSELLFQAPIMIWAIGALLRSKHEKARLALEFFPDTLIDSPKVPIVLLPFATLICVTSITCIFDFWQWPVPMEEKIELTKLYGPYVALCEYIEIFGGTRLMFLAAFMGVDMLIRLNGVINRASAVQAGKKLQ